MTTNLESSSSTPQARAATTSSAGLWGGLAAVVAPVAALLVLRLLIVAAQHAWPPGGLTGAATVDEVVLGLLSWAAVVLCAWLALGVTLTALTKLPGRLGQAVGTLADRVTPAVLRRSLTMLIGVSVSTVALPAGTASGAMTRVMNPAVLSLTGGDETVGAPGSFTDPASGPGRQATARLEVATPAFGASGPAPAHSTNPADPTGAAVGPGYRATEERRDTVAGPGWRPTPPMRSAGERPTLLTPTPRTESAPIEHLTVRRGDCLWSIVARHLGPGATDAEIAHEWPRWYAANRAVIGDDPDLIYAGQQLLPPLEGARS